MTCLRVPLPLVGGGALADKDGLNFESDCCWLLPLS